MPELIDAVATHADEAPAAARAQRIGALLALTAALGFGPPLSVEIDPAVMLHVVAAELERTAADDDAIASAVRGLRTFLVALPRGDLATVSPDRLERVELAASRALPAVLAAAPRRVPHLQICAGFGSFLYVVRMLRDRAAGTVTEMRGEWLGERLDHVALLADELDACVRRARLEASGNQLNRYVRIQQADAASADGAARH